MRLSKTFRFEASHQLSNHPGKCARLHGHSWVLSVSVDGPVNPATGMVCDYGLIKEVVQPIVDSLDHQHLGTGYVHGNFLPPTVISFPAIPALPTSENLLLWIAYKLIDTELFRFSELRINETCTSECVLTFTEFKRIQRREEWTNGSSEETKSTEDQAAPARTQSGEETQGDVIDCASACDDHDIQVAIEHDAEAQATADADPDYAQSRKFDKAFNPGVSDDDDDIPF